MTNRRVYWALLALLLGALPEGAAAQIRDIALEQTLARELGVRVGDTLRLGAAPDAVTGLVRVAAVYRPRPDPAEVAKRERHIRMHLPDLATLLGTPDRVDRLSIGLNPGIPADTAVARFNGTAFGYWAYSSNAIASESSQTFLVVSRFHRAIGVITIVASAVFLLCIMLLKVEERRLDAAMMRFIGVRRRTIFLAILLEAVVLAVLGSVIGACLAYLAGAATNAYYGRFFETSLIFSRITPALILFSVTLSLALGLAAGAVAAWRLVRTRPLVLWGRG
jgi:putative ABC transport system permease protein